MKPEPEMQSLARSWGELVAGRAVVLEAFAPVGYEKRLRSLRAQLVRSRDVLTRTEHEWFLDNYYLIAEVAAGLRSDVPPHFYRELPVVEAAYDSRAGVQLPRVYVIARAFIERSLGPPDRHSIEAFLQTLQTYLPLRIAELWALPAMIQVVCIERLLKRLEAVQDGEAPESESAAESDVVAFSVRTLISLRSIAWKQVFENVSLVHQALCDDPLGTYAEMDFETCDRYRRVVERLATQAGTDELKVARLVVEIAAASDDAESIERHVGFYLIDSGRSLLERALGVHPRLSVRSRRWVLRLASPVYLLLVAFAAVVVMASVAVYLFEHEDAVWPAAAAMAVAALPAIGFAVVWVHWLLTHLVRPRRLPRLKLGDGVPAELKTLVVVPVLLGDLDEVHQLVQRLELHFLANPEPNLRFALLGDLVDAKSQVMAADAVILERAREGIELLNQRHGTGHEPGQPSRGAGDGPFHLLVRERRYNPTEGVWMGWERKRGKLEELNRLLAGDAQTSYTVHVGRRDDLGEVRFVITLDSDTQLPRGAARNLISIMAHPLNRARFRGDRVVAGYTVLQPRLDINPAAANRSRFSRIFASDVGLDIYSRAVSDIYQDFFGAGVYVGKGIYDVDSFRRSLKGRIPENRILSHDLFEGILGRAGLVSDVVLYEDYPPSYLSYARRLHRWIRGDWQLLPWLRPRVPTVSGSRLLNPLSRIDRWKVIDNLRRSLTPVATLALLVSAWTWLPGNPLIWTAIALVLSAGPVLTELASLSPSQHGIWRWLLSIVFLPHEAVVVTDAITRTLVRLLVTRKRLLEWTTAAHHARALAGSHPRRRNWWEMVAGPVGGLLVIALVALIQPSAIWIATPFCVAWFLSPELATLLARPPHEEAKELTPSARKQLRLLSRRTWLFFETFVRPDDNWLPPDNVQHQPSVRIAHRTSPTNIGLYLTACATAYDLGYLGLSDFCHRVRNTLQSVQQLERHRGQLLNWYETQTLKPLTPKYVSTVDNGNLAACVIALKGACTDFATGPVFRSEPWYGLMDVAELLREAIGKMPNGVGDTPAIARPLDEIFLHLREAAKSRRSWLERVARLADVVADLSAALEAAVRQCAALDKPVDYEVLDWLQLLDRQVDLIRSALEPVGSWYFTLRESPEGLERVFADDAVLGHEHRGMVRAAAKVSLDQVTAFSAALDRHLERLDRAGDLAVRRWIETVRATLQRGALEADALVKEALDVARACDAEISTMDFGFLYDADAHLMSIGYDVSAARSDPNHYDLLASEARLASLVAISLGQVPREHWVHLGRPVARVEKRASLLSWSGTMFEFLMPLLFTRTYDSTLLGTSTRAAVDRQMRHGHARKLPWGVSESGFAVTDSRGDYQYRAFGVPGLGLKRGLEEDDVIAPYASILAVGIRPLEVLANIAELERLGALSQYGFAEAIDYSSLATAAEQRAGTRRPVIVNSHMAHHQGMIMVALGNVLVDETMVSRFHLDARIQTVAHLLHERVVKPVIGVEYDVHGPLPEKPRVVVAPPQAWQPPQDVRQLVMDPAHHFLSNGSLHLDCDALGHTRLWRKQLELRPREVGADAHRAGSFCLYLGINGDSAEVVSGAMTPAEVTYWPHCVEAITRAGGLTLHQFIFVAPDDDVEIRQIDVVNETKEEMQIALTGCAEVSINRAEEHHRHPAFSRMFLETKSGDGGRVLVCRRRPRSPDDRFPVVAQALSADPAFGVSWETSREAFIGRGRTLEQPVAIEGDADLGGHAGTVIDPCLAQRVTFRLEPGARASLAWLTAVGDSEQEALALIESHRQVSALAATRERAARATADRIATLGIETTALEAIQRLGSQLSARPRAPGHADGGSLRRRLWGHGISGDVPVILFRRRSDETQHFEWLLRARGYLLAVGLHCDLVVVAHDVVGYVDEVRERIRAVVRRLKLSGAAGELTVLALPSLREEDNAALEAAAAFVCDSESESVAVELERNLHHPRQAPAFVPTLAEDASSGGPLPRATGLLFDNGQGGFSPDSKEYVVYLSEGEQTPAPWCNVIANPTFGCIVSERGLGASWAVNAGEFRLSPWSNDPISDPPSEAIYLRDEETGAVWTPTPGPAPAPGAHEIRHGMGTTGYRHKSHGLGQRLQVTVHPEDPIKVVEVEIDNLLDRGRRVTVTYFVDWVLGTRKAANAPFVVSEFDGDNRAVFAHNMWSVDFPEQVAFVASSERIHGFSCDRTEFLGSGGFAAPSALSRWGLSNSERGAQPCAALQVHLDLPAKGKARFHFALGACAGLERARTLAGRGAATGFASEVAKANEARWSGLLGAVTVRSPDPALDLMINGWALYQAIVCRLFARTGFYQSSGAFGFRDQLQDVMAMALCAPELVREHLLRAAAKQFEAGDVLHWWHPPHGTGVRTRCSDDLLWLPFVTDHYLSVTGDYGVLDEVVPFLRGTELAANEHERYGAFERGEFEASLLEHCLRALDRAYQLGPHGLPRIGSGDWNDGMNLVGAGGVGESVWLGWFLYRALRRFAALISKIGGSHAHEAKDLDARADALLEPLESAWDGRWYQRATFDDGTPLGTAAASEARIDSIAQSWAVISEAAQPARAEQAVHSALTELVDPEARVIRLLSPPFAGRDRRRGVEPGYIAGYPPGVRENGAQYTHAAVWLAWAAAELGDTVDAGKLIDLLTPIRSAATAQQVDRYRIEPYVLAGDVYSIAEHRGRGGWSWYTGAAAWYWRLGVEQMLGLQFAWPYLRFRPRLPPSWNEVAITLRQPEWTLSIAITEATIRGRGAVQLVLDGEVLAEPRIDLRALHGTHDLEVSVAHRESQTGS